MEKGRWTPWGNGIRIDYEDGWTDWILIGPTGPMQFSWEPGTDRSKPPSMHGRAVKVDGAAASIAGAYELLPEESTVTPVAVTLLSNGLAFNAIDTISSGSWRITEDGWVTIVWESGWFTKLKIRNDGSVLEEQWHPGLDRNGPPSSRRIGKRL
jgi:hypothetical protein